MIVLVTGGSGSGKSAFAEDRILLSGRQGAFTLLPCIPLIWKVKRECTGTEI